jgi:hypothetical protein
MNAVIVASSSITSRLAALEAMGTSDALSAPAAADQLAAVLGAGVGDVSVVDGAVRAVAARALSQLCARSIGVAPDTEHVRADREGCANDRDGGGVNVPATVFTRTAGTATCALNACRAELRGRLAKAAVPVLAVALGADTDRYVRSFAAEALASFLCGCEAASVAASASASASATPATPSASKASSVEWKAACEVAMAALNAVVPPEDVAHALQRCRRASVSSDAVHDAVRWLGCRRRCPLTTAESPF